MDLGKIVHFKVSIGSSFFCEFDSWKVQTEKGEVFEERNVEKPTESLIYMCLISHKNLISMQYSNFFLHFNVISGNLDNLSGEYDVEFMGNKGKITAVELPMEDIGDILT